VAVIGHDDIDYLSDAARFVWHSVYIEDRDGLRQLARQEFGASDEVLVDEIAGSASVDYDLGGRFLHGVRRL
jgi:hypothetical protein